MREIGAVIARVLHECRPGVIASGPNRGKPSLVQFDLDPAVADEANARVADLLARHPLYPGIDL
jgi:glycine hydroxymethyltransferase